MFTFNGYKWPWHSVNHRKKVYFKISALFKVSIFIIPGVGLRFSPNSIPSCNLLSFCILQLFKTFGCASQLRFLRGAEAESRFIFLITVEKMTTGFTKMPPAAVFELLVMWPLVSMGAERYKCPPSYSIHIQAKAFADGITITNQLILKQIILDYLCEPMSHRSF